jgi:serine/threonine-protein kinase
MLCGRPPFEGSAAALLRAHAEEIPPPPSARLGRPLPGELEALVMRCLAKDPALRYQDAGELAAALEAWSAAASP